MKQLIYSILVLGIGLSMTACKDPSPDQVKKVMEENPDILFSVIEKHPKKFLEVVNAAAQKAQMEARRDEEKAQEEKRDEEFKNPKKPEIQEWRAILGPKDAPITLVEYSDFQCPFCKRGANTVKEVMEEYEGKVRFVFKHLPLDFHPAAMPAAQIFEAINLQDSKKAYDWHDIVFENQAELKSSDNGVSWMIAQAKKLGLDADKVKKDMASDTVKKRVEADLAEAKKYEFQGTPGYLVNGVSIKGAYPLPEFKKIIDRHLKK